ncbi:MAG: TlpA family protein disulfide reductase [Desulfarculaceae bacterium]|nr:TlpA family protein disulfide reductase [Desulfarculaceae bacterium]
MHRILALLAILALILLGGPAPASAKAVGLVKLGSPFPPAAFEAPKEAAARAYLGLAEGQDLDPASVPGRLVIVEFFNMYCTHCQREAPKVNRLYQLIQDKGWGDEIKLVGVGAKNSAYEVDVFVKHFKVPFPMVPDLKLKSLDLLGEIFTPHFVVILKDAKGNRVIYSKSGPPPAPEKWLPDLAAQAGLK